MLNSWCSSVYLRVLAWSHYTSVFFRHIGHVGWDPNTGFDVSTPFIYTHKQTQTQKHSSDLCGGCLMKLHKFGSCCFLLCIWETAQKEFADFLSAQKKICRLHLCNADSVGNNVAVTLSSTFLVLAIFTVCYWIIYDTLLYGLQLIKTYLFKALWVYFTDQKCIRMMDSDLIRPRSVMSLQVPFGYILDPFTVTYCPDKIRIHY